MLTKEEHEALGKVMAAYSQLQRTYKPDLAAKLTQAWAMFARAVEKNN